MEPRPYRDLSDFDKMRCILTEGCAANTGTYYVHPGDVNWWLFYPDQSAEFAQRIFLWEDGDETLGWALLTPTEQCLDVFVHPRLRGAPQAEAMFDWAEAQLTAQVRASRGEVIHTWEVFADDDWRVPMLERRGFVRRKGDVYFTRSLSGPLPGPTLPDGYAVRPTTGEDEAEERARASHGAFQSKWSWDKYMARRLGFMRSPYYEREHDMVVVTPEGRIASFCIFWLDAANRVGHFEPVGTHPDFQRRGCGQAVLLESLRRLQACGMETATVCTNDDNVPAIGLYESVGFRDTNRLLQFSKSI